MNTIGNPRKPSPSAKSSSRPRAVADASAGHPGHRKPETGKDYFSPPCYLPEIDPVYFGYLGSDETIAFLNILLQAERAGARGVSAVGRGVSPYEGRQILMDVAQDEARFCAMLTGHIRRFGATPCNETGGFYDKLLAAKTMPERLDLLDRGQGWVVRKLRETLPRIWDMDLYADLREMLEVHETNIARCASLKG